MPRKIIYFALFLVSLFVLAGCSSSLEIEQVRLEGPTSAKLNEPVKINSYQLVTQGLEGDSVKWEASNITNVTLRWAVEPSEGATVSEDGLFKATKPGTYLVSAGADGKSDRH